MHQIKNKFKEKFGGGEKEDPEFASVGPFFIRTSRYEVLDKPGRLSNFEVDFLLQLTFESMTKKGPSVTYVPTDFYAKYISLGKVFAKQTTNTDLAEDDFIFTGYFQFKVFILHKDTPRNEPGNE